MVGVPDAHVVSINRPTPQAMIIVHVVILTEITGNWEIKGGVLTMEVTSWKGNYGGVTAQNYGPAPQFDDGPSSPIEFLNSNSFKAHGWTLIRH